MKKNVIYFKHYFICVFILALILCSTCAFGENNVTTVLLVRHAEKVGPPYNPDTLTPLTIEGWARAKKLAHVARKAGVTAIYATDFKRTQQTAQPLAELLGLEPISYTSSAVLADLILSSHEGEVVLVVGHGPTVLDIAKELGANITVQYTNEFDNLYVVTHNPGEANGSTNIINLQYGESNIYDNFESTSCEMTTLLLVRHDAEQGDTGQRAEKLAHAAQKAGVTAIYITDTNQTVEELADDLGISENTQYDSNHIPDLIDDVMGTHDGSVVIISGENNTISGIFEELGVSPTPSSYENEYDNLFVVTIYDSDVLDAKVLNLQYGAPSPPENISVVHVIDRTGSMGGYGYMEPAKTAAQNFIALMEIDDEVGIAAFDDYGCDDEDSKAEIVFSLAKITDETVINDAIDSIDSLDARGCTSIGAGIKLAQTDFLNNAIVDQPHAMVLLTDGFENTSPLVSEILPTIPEDTDIYTVALGSTADTDLMENIADITGGMFYESPDTGDLLSIYYQIQGDLELGEMADLETGTMGSGNDTRIVTIDHDASEATFVVGWLQKKGRLKLTLKDPNGNRITPKNTNVKIGNDSTYYFIRIKNPLPGDWEVHIIRTDSGTFQIDYTSAEFVKGASKLWSFIPEFTFAGDCLLTKVHLYDSHTLLPITGASVKAKISSPQTYKYTLNYNYLKPKDTGWSPGSIMSLKPKGKMSKSAIASVDRLPLWASTLRCYDQKSIKETGKSIFQYDTMETMLYDDGTHGDEQVGDGVYTNCDKTKIAGSYNIIFSISGVTPSGANFKRRLMSTAAIKPGQVNAEKTLVRIDPTVIDIDEGSEGIITIIPMDRFGNVWGPGFKSNISVSTTAGILSGDIIDNGDGFYFQKIKSTGVEKTGRVIVTIDDIEMKTKPVVLIKKIQYPFSFSIHSGAAIPTGTFANDFDPGLNILLDINYHFSPQLSVVGLFGYNAFKSKITSVDDTYWINLSVNLKYRVLTGALSSYFSGGPEYCIPKTGNSGFGVNLGVGLDYEFNNLLTLELGADYHTVFGKDVQFMHSHAGVIFRF
jgi:broad specificity phosphatase PhoE